MAPNASGRANRVAPDGTRHAVADRGDCWGNRGQLLDRHGEPARHARGRLWIVCALEFRGRQRVQWQPNRLTELYFLDEATALAAGHRPCGECRHAAYQRFTAAWRRAHGLERVGADEIDRVLHAGRLETGGPATHLTHEAALADLPDTTMIEADGGFWLVRGERLFPWGFAGYGEPQARSAFPTTVTVRTPRPTVATLRAGFVPDVHASADRAPGATPLRPREVASRGVLPAWRPPDDEGRPTCGRRRP